MRRQHRKGDACNAFPRDPMAAASDGSRASESESESGGARAAATAAALVAAAAAARLGPLNPKP